MITALFLLVFSFLSFLIGLFPTGGGFPSEIHSAVGTLGGYVGLMDVFIPVSVIAWCLTFIFGIEIAIFGFKTVKWLVGHLPFLGGHGNR